MKKIPFLLTDEPAVKCCSCSSVTDPTLCKYRLFVLSSNQDDRISFESASCVDLILLDHIPTFRKIFSLLHPQSGLLASNHRFRCPDESKKVFRVGELVNPLGLQASIIVGNDVYDEN